MTASRTIAFLAARPPAPRILAGTGNRRRGGARIPWTTDLKRAPNPAIGFSLHDRGVDVDRKDPAGHRSRVYPPSTSPEGIAP